MRRQKFIFSFLVLAPSGAADKVRLGPKFRFCPETPILNRYRGDFYAWIMTCTVRTRFTRRQADLLYIGLRPLILNHVNLTHTGRSPGAHPDLLTARFFHSRGLYTDEFMQAIVGLWKGFQFGRGKQCRIPIDYVKVAACALAVRTALRQIRHGHVEAWRRGIQATANRLLRRLEALRKRLKRTIIKTKGQDSFRALASSWRQFLTWLRLNLLTCPCLIRRPDPVYRSRQRLINEMVRVTSRELQSQRREIPTDRMLRKLVRDALKNVHHFRTPWTLPLLKRNPAIAASWFAEYVTRRMSR